MVRKCFVPKTEVSAGSVQDLINQMREGNGETENTTPSENQVMTEDSQTNEALGKKGIVPKGILSVDPEIQRMRDLLTSGREAFIDSDGTISAVGDVDTSSATKAKTVPKAIVSVNI